MKTPAELQVLRDQIAALSTELARAEREIFEASLPDWRVGDQVRPHRTPEPDQSFGAYDRYVGQVGEVIEVITPKSRAVVVRLQAVRAVVVVRFGPDCPIHGETLAFADTDLLPADAPWKQPKKRGKR